MGRRLWIAAMVCLIIGALALPAAARARAKAPRSFFGIVPQTALGDTDYQLMGKGRVGTLRIPIAWASVQPTQGSPYDWSSVDRSLVLAAQNGIEVFPFLHATPTWVATGLDGNSCGSKCGSYPPTSAAALTAWSQFVAAAVDRYRRNGTFWTENPTVPKLPIKAWQVWSEQNSPTSFSPKPKPKRYAKLLSAASDSIRSVDSSADVVLGGMAGLQGVKGATTAWDYLAKLYKVKGASKDFDGVAPHPYGSKVSKIAAQIGLFRAAMKKAHDSSTKMWVTRIGYGSASGGNPLNKGKKGQAKSLTDAYKYFLSNRKKLHLQAVAWFSWADSKVSMCAWCSTSGLHTRSLKPKPSWKAFTKLTRGSCRRAGRDRERCGGGSNDDAPAAPAVPASFFGVTPQSAMTDEDFARMEQGNVGTMRVVVPWQAVQPTEGQPPDFSLFDPTVLAAAAHGIHLIPTLFGTPDWVAQIDGHGDCSPGCAVFAPRSDAALAAWRTFVGAAVDRYGPDGTLWEENPDAESVPIDTWQVWNEQNSPSFYQPQPDPQSYGRLLSATADEIRSRDPGADVILGGMAGLQSAKGATTAWDYLAKLYKIGGASEDFDGVAAHPYAAHEDKIEAQVTRIHDEITAADDNDAELWITEIGASSTDGDNPLERGPEGQAALLGDAMRFFVSKRRSWNVPAVIWYSWRDVPSPGTCDWCAASGLFGQSGFSPKPAWTELMSLTGGT